MLAKITPPLLMLKRRLSKKPFKKYKGDIKQITESILRNCYKKNHFVVSDGHFKQFYCRDFGMITKSLLKLGYKKEVFSTLDYVISMFKKHNKVTTTISNNKPVDFFTFGVDSLPFLLRSIRLAMGEGYKLKEKHFLQSQIHYYFKTIYNPETKLVKIGKFSSAKDHYTRKSCSYDNSAMIGLCNEVDDINKLFGRIILLYPVNKKESKSAFQKALYNGEYFYDDLDRMEYIASDAQIFPFYWRVFTSKLMKAKVYEYLKPLSKHLPIQYTKEQIKEKESYLQSKLAPNYEGNTYWLHIGICYVETLDDKDELKRNLANVKKMILQYKNFIEVFNPDMTPYKSLFYIADESMSWIAPYYYLLQEENMV